ncbi:MAG: hypothetical protein AB4080_03575 [Trichodesmium sp.]
MPKHQCINQGIGMEGIVALLNTGIIWLIGRQVNTGIMVDVRATKYPAIRAMPEYSNPPHIRGKNLTAF